MCSFRPFGSLMFLKQPNRKLVSECYVDGFVNGEAIRMKKHMDTEQHFTLVQKRSTDVEVQMFSPLSNLSSCQVPTDIRARAPQKRQLIIAGTPLTSAGPVLGPAL